MTETEGAYAGLRVLVVEDEILVGMMLEDILVEEFGCAIAAHCSRLEDGLEAARKLDLDVAFLDLNLRGQSSIPIAEVLRERGVPVLITSGYGDQALPLKGDGVDLVAKPYTADQIGAALAKVRAR